MNVVSFVGRLVRPIEVKELEENRRVVNNTLAVHRYQRDKNGEQITDFIPIVAWNRQADLLKRFCEKGDQVAVAGRMQSRDYVNKENQRVYVVECLVTDITVFHQKQASEGKQRTEIKSVYETTMQTAEFEQASPEDVEAVVEKVRRQ